jgi:protein ImuB
MEASKEEPPRPTRDGTPPKAPAPHVPNLSLFDAEAVLRDYYVAEDDGGRRFWIFRQGLYGGHTSPLWFLHGFFP